MGADALSLERLLHIYLSALVRYIEPKLPMEVRCHVGTNDVVQVILHLDDVR
jgi:hypothetical protein